ncbi:MAG: NAD(+) synthase, partial [Planctomycetota bacterium]|nr:NAD(+) synthase [Planctomycetota bacterium]
FYDTPPLPARLAGIAAGENRRACRRCLCAGNSAPDAEKPPLGETRRQKLDELAEVYSALVLGLRDYARKNGFSTAILGLSGGVDSSLVAAIAAEALGTQNVWAAIMPSRYSASETMSDAERVARNLGLRFLVLPVEPIHSAFLRELMPHLRDAPDDPENLTDQNLQARIRAVYLMALSNKFKLLVLNTSNKSEAAVGYGTLYGDMIGGFAVIKDLFKSQVWDLARYVNQRQGREVIPQTVIDRVPTAELRPNQEDRQSIPDYPLLDPILELYIERDLTYDEIVAAGHDPAIVKRVIALVDRNEFKRRQAVLGTRVSAKAFGKDRRLPVTNRFRQW